MSKRLYLFLIFLAVISGSFVNYVIGPGYPLWLRATLVGLFVGVAVLIIGIVYQRLNNRSSGKL